MSGQYQRLVELIETRAGENFRAAFQYDDEDWTALYLRSDLATDELRAVVPALADRARAHEPLIRERDYPEMGAHHASISLHDEAVLIQFHEGDRSGLVVTLDTAVARNLSEFVERCESILDV